MALPKLIKDPKYRKLVIILTLMWVWWSLITKTLFGQIIPSVLDPSFSLVGWFVSGFVIMLGLFLTSYWVYLVRRTL